MADTQVSKTCALKGMWVRLPPAAHIYYKYELSFTLDFIQVSGILMFQHNS